MGLYRSLALALHKLACFRCSGQWIVYSGAKWGRMETHVEESIRIFRPVSLTPPLSHFFLAHFSLLFPNFLKPCYR